MDSVPGFYPNSFSRCFFPKTIQVEIAALFSVIRNSYLAKRLHNEITESAKICHDIIQTLIEPVVDSCHSNPPAS